MAGFHHPGDPYFPNHGNNRWLDKEPEEDPEEESDGEPEEGVEDEPAEPEEEQDEYVMVDLDYDELDQEPDEEKGVEEACSEPHQLEAPSNFRMFQGVDTDYLRALEEAVISLKLQLIMAKARVVRAE
ncbi:unnamed protein product [Lactuca saligna]|uniref:Uncharacterized protein n=1 Tax=Lactuca saligna TaxID=75948 RepID=A0AA35Z3Y1_LACSI|nr:unnamed protein product [Lactuca saligna]